MKLDPDFILDDQKRLCHAPQDFDEYDEDLMHDVMGNERLAKPVQALLITYAQIKQSVDSFGADALNNKLAVESLMPILAKLRQACIEEWRDQ